jgi:phytoene dehydrogenase-like protein
MRRQIQSRLLGWAGWIAKPTCDAAMTNASIPILLGNIVRKHSRSFSTSNHADVIVIGAGHNGLVAATLLARAGLSVKVFEDKPVVGGACKTEYPFVKGAPGLPHSTGAYLLGVAPPELIHLLGLRLELLRRDPHYFLPTTDERSGYLLFGSNEDDTREQFHRYFSAEDWRAHCALQEELSMLREDVAPSWFRAPLSLEATAEAYVRPNLRQTFIDLCRGTVRQYLDRFEFKSGLLKTMYATTDGFSGLSAGWDTPGSGHNFLLHNMCRLPDAAGTWMVVRGGMGRVTQELVRVAREAGADVCTASKVRRIVVSRRENTTAATGVEVEGPRGQIAEYSAHAVLANCDPFRMQVLFGERELPSQVNGLLSKLRRPGMTMKVNLALSGLPKYRCLPEQIGQHRTTTHLLPQESDPVAATQQAFEEAMTGALPEFPTIEVYTATTVDTSLTDDKSRISAALFVQWVPHQPAGSSWEQEKEAYVDHLLGIYERFAPGVSKLVDDVFALAPPDIETHFGISGGHIHHVDNCFAFDERFPHAVPGMEGLYSCSAGTHPGGSVIGCAGHNAAMVVAKDLGRYDRAGFVPTLKF